MGGGNKQLKQTNFSISIFIPQNSVMISISIHSLNCVLLIVDPDLKRSMAEVVLELADEKTV